MVQNKRCSTGGSGLPLAVMISKTSESESEEVTKKVTTTTMASIDVSDCRG